MLPTSVTTVPPRSRGDISLKAAGYGEDRQGEHDDVRRRGRLGAGAEKTSVDDPALEGLPAGFLPAGHDVNAIGQSPGLHRPDQRSADQAQPDDGQRLDLGAQGCQLSRPRKRAIFLMSSIRVTKRLGIRDWGPSQRASSGWGWTSIMRPSAPGGQGGQGDGVNQVPAAGGVAGIDYHRQVGEVLHGRNGGDVYHVAGVGLEGPHPPFAEDDVGVAVG